MSRIDALRVSCPYCGSKRGYACKYVAWSGSSSVGVWTACVRPHKARVTRAKQPPKKRGSR
jgi:hypothetical protein